MSENENDRDDESLLDRLRSTVRGLQQTPARSTAPTPLHEINVRDAVRQLARNRVSQTIRQLRAARGYSYAQVQDKTGLSQQLLFDVEYKDRRLNLEELRSLAACFEVSVNDILGIDLEP